MTSLLPLPLLVLDQKDAAISQAPNVNSIDTFQITYNDAKTYS